MDTPKIQMLTSCCLGDGIRRGAFGRKLGLRRLIEWDWCPYDRGRGELIYVFYWVTQSKGAEKMPQQTLNL